MSFLLTGAGIAAVGAGVDIANGISEKNAGNRLAAANKRPMYVIPGEYQQNDNIASSQAENGLPESTINFYNTQANRGLSSGIGAILDGGGDVDNLSKLYDQFSQGLSNESAQDAQMKEGHINTFINTNKDLAGQQTQQWVLNDLNPYKDTAQLAAADKAAGMQNISTGIGEAVGGASTLANGELYKSANSSAGTMGAKLNRTQLNLTAPTLNLGSTTNNSQNATIPAFNGMPSTTTPYDASGNGGQVAANQVSGGAASVLGSLSNSDVNSPQLQQLISILNRNQSAA